MATRTGTVRTGAKPKVAARARRLLCFFDRIDETAVGGWAVDFEAPEQSLRLRVMIDGVIADVVPCDLHRDDARLVTPVNSRIGFYYEIPARYRDGLRHTITFATVDGEAVPLSSRNGEMGALNFCLAKPTRVEAVLDGLVGGLIQGWAHRVDDAAGTRLGGVKILITAAGQPLAEVVAEQFRADVAGATGGDAACGFSVYLPEGVRQRRMTLQVFAMPERQEILGSPLDIEFPSAGASEQIETLMARTDELFSFAFNLRRELQSALPRERYFLEDYARWAAASLPLALARAEARYGALPEPGPLVSVVCPVYRPAIGEFLAAVDSVRAQTYPNWELLLVDDASGDAALSAAMRELAAADKRIRVLARKRNGGIARATNDALAAAKGELVAFFDHDDLLEPGALEIMLRAWRATGAKLLYSDEDKVERGGALGEPHFKPDFNYRFLLEINYICHFVMVEAGALRAAGGLDPALDGAQDHDLLLRLCEHLAPAEIHHVPEVLYHWRKTGSSTAAAGAQAKPKAVTAGETAVQAHLARRKLPAKVSSREGMTCYEVEWQFRPKARQGAKVSILIPFRDHIAMTRECVDAIRTHTKDVAYEIILLDNWSSKDGAEAFTAAQANMPNTKVIRIAEPFNYSRINNIGVSAAAGEYLLFMNNDVFVSEPDWLRRMLDECLADPKLGAVGAKLLYPNGTVQHAGVVLGVGGVADHAFRGLDGRAPGYMAHAMAAQEVSAVTAACMLVRKRAFLDVSGFDEESLKVAFNDVDLCAKLTKAGWKIVYLPDVVAEHRESISRGDDFDNTKLGRFMWENEVMRQRYAKVLPNDPHYNMHFSREGGVYHELRLLRPEQI
ncbi:glycosyltransferase [Acidocella sp. KAb 2-4]|uniref:glycosyltransferase family 2 protein n=1 Tax=Acidocella sp. KAb 2-4 TaxID=2885158 RepID=UPI001D07C545|nr:glycosyltransferase family 2 protein [Acidocella sp. KAb 2-4]MCB5944134.1 glycosyltransferase family 2 protein [Acidocella sp. KAb 2-4]